MDEKINKNGGVNENQYGFGKGRSTVMAVKEVVKMTKECGITWAVLETLDIKNAFNIACQGIIIIELSERGGDHILSKPGIRLPLR